MSDTSYRVDLPPAYAADDSYHEHPIRAVLMGPPTADLLEKIRAAVADPTILDEREPYVWQAQASNVNEDAYSTRMGRSTLDNFAADAIAGVAFMNSHRTGGHMGTPELPLGRTFDARVVGPSGAGPTRLDVTSYLLRGVDLTALPTERFIEGLRSGIARDVSVGFHGGEYRCGICGKDMRTDWSCHHYPGLSYPKTDKKGEATGELVRATATIENAHLSELSSVFDGATPGCMVYKAVRLVEDGQIRGQTIDLLERKLRIRLPHPARVFPAAAVPVTSVPPEPAPGPDHVPPTRGEETLMQFTEAEILALRTALAEIGVNANEGAEVASTVRAIVDEIKTARGNAPKLVAAEARLTELETRASTAETALAALTADADGLRPLADIGRQYQTDLVEEAVLEGKRALGTGFAEETYRASLRTLPLESVKQLRDDWKRIGDATFQPGRLTTEKAERNGAAVPAGGIPDSAYKTGR